MVSYLPLWKTLLDKGINKTKLAEITGLSSATITKLVNNKNVNVDVIVRICVALDCNVSDVMEIVK